jgi:hypothetical protein
MRRGYSIVAPHSAAAGGRHAAGETAMPMMAMRQSRYNAEAGAGLTAFPQRPSTGSGRTVVHGVVVKAKSEAEHR